jgi:Uma2 family endonuclease
MAIHTPTGIKLTYEDYLQFPEDGRRHELIDGEHVVSATPLLRHQQVLARSFYELFRQVDKQDRGQVLFAPVALHLSQVDVVEPDLIVVLPEHQDVMVPNRLVGPADLVVEVLSPSTAARDRGVKKALYLRAGVQEYWIVDSVQQTVEQLVAVGGKFESAGTHHESITLRILQDVTVDLVGDVWV